MMDPLLPLAEAFRPEGETVAIPMPVAAADRIISAWVDIDQAGSPGEVRRAVLDAIAHELDAETIAIYELGESCSVLKRTACVGECSLPHVPSIVPLGHGRIARVVLEGIVDPGHAEEREYPEPEDGVLMACVPMRTSTRVVGAIALFSRGGPTVLAERDAAFLLAIGREAGTKLYDASGRTATAGLERPW